jgi:hypothetical protein
MEESALSRGHAIAALMITIQSTGDISLETLEELFRAPPFDDAVIDRSQYFFKSADAPSWVQIVLGIDSWQDMLRTGISAFAVGLLAQAGKETWRKRAGVLGSVKGGALLLCELAKRIATLQNLVGSTTQIAVGIPVEDDAYAAILRISDANPEVIETQLVWLGLHSHGIANILTQQDFKPLGWVVLNLDEEGELAIRWMDRESLQEREEVLRPR